MIDHVSRVMFAGLHNHTQPLLTRWNYRPEDPYAVSLSIRCSNDRWIEWLFSRELLTAGLSGQAGVGDVRVDRTLQCDNARLEVCIGGDENRVILVFDAALVEKFLALTFEVVAAGAESTALDLDGLIAKLSDSWAH